MAIGDICLGLLAWLGATVLGAGIAVILAKLYIKAGED